MPYISNGNELFKKRKNMFIVNFFICNSVLFYFYTLLNNEINLI